MQYAIEWTQKARRELSKIDPRYRRPILEKVTQLADFPKVRLDIKHLNGSAYRLRHGDYRILFEVADGTAKIIQIQAVKRRNSRTYS